jgi:hypothetical protein
MMLLNKKWNKKWGGLKEDYFMAKAKEERYKLVLVKRSNFIIIITIIIIMITYCIFNNFNRTVKE